MKCSFHVLIQFGARLEIFHIWTLSNKLVNLLLGHSSVLEVITFVAEKHERELSSIDICVIEKLLLPVVEILERVSICEREHQKAHIRASVEGRSQ